MSVKSSLDLKIERLQRELKEAKAFKSKEARKERNGQLITLGILIEAKYKSLDTVEQNKLKAWASDELSGRNLERAKAVFLRLDAKTL